MDIYIRNVYDNILRKFANSSRNNIHQVISGPASLPLCVNVKLLLVKILKMFLNT